MSGQRAEVVDLGFTVADGEQIAFANEDESLSVSFVDWQGVKVTFVCRDAIAFRWQGAEYFLTEGERYDSTHLIVGSEWLSQHQEQGVTWEGVDFHHYKMNFNAAGVLEVICTEIERLAEPSDTDP